MAETPAPKSKREIPDVQKTIGGREFTLRFSIRASSALKQVWNLKNDTDVSNRVAHMQIEDIPTLLWATTRAHHPEITVEDMLDLADAEGLPGLKEILEEVVAAAMPPERKNPRTAAASTTR